MKNHFLLIVLVFVFGDFLHAQNTQQSLYYQGELDSLYSEVLQENRKFLVYIPQSTKNLKMGKEKHPVLYLLDGSSQFATTTQIVKKLSFESIPPMVIIGILNTNRTRDLTPSHVPKDPSGFDVSQSGGGEAFLDFLETELIPYVAGKHETRPYRTFIGHSLGGMLSGYTLATRPHLFHNVLSLDPTSTWDDGLMYRKLKEAGDQGRLAGKGYFLGVADPKPTGNEKIDSLLTSFRLPNEQIANYLQNNTDIHFTFKNYPQGSHTDMVIPGTYDGLKSVYSWYADLNQQLLEAADPFISKDLSNQELIEKINNIHHQMSVNFGYEVKPKEDMINSLGYWSLQAGDLNRSKLFFEMNIANYPESANVYDSMGDYYMAVKNKEQAIHFFQEALKRDENPQTQKKLATLQK